MKVQINIPLGKPDPETYLRELISAVEQAPDPTKVESDDPIEDAVLRVFAGDTNIPDEIIEAFTIYMSETRRGALEAFLLAGGDTQDIMDFLGVPEIVTTIYRRYFFRIEVLRTRLDTEDYIRTVCSSTTVYSEFHQNLIRASLELGLEYLKCRFNDTYKVPGDVALARSLRLAYVKMCETERAPAGSKLAEIARRNAKLLIDNVRSEPVLSNIQSEDRTQDELLFALEARKAAGDITEAPDLDNVELLH